MKLIDLIEALRAELETHGNIEAVVRSEEFDFEPLKWVDTIEHDGETCLLID